jgi:hypothetical protein
MIISTTGLTVLMPTAVMFCLLLLSILGLRARPCSKNGTDAAARRVVSRLLPEHRLLVGCDASRQFRIGAISAGATECWDAA